MIEDKDFAVVYNNSVGGTYEVMLKYSEQEIRDHITRYGTRLASDDIKEVAKDMVAEQFQAITKQRIPVFEMPSGDILYAGYNRRPTRLMSVRWSMPVLFPTISSPTTTTILSNPTCNPSIRN